MTRIRFTTLAALLLAVMLISGCGGGGGGGGGSSLQDQIDMLTMERDDAQDEVTSLKAEVTRLEDELTTAENQVTQLETLIGDAVNPASASLRGQLAAAQAEAARLRGELTAAQGQVSEAEQRASEAETEADRRVEEAEQQANVSVRAGPLLTALDLETGDERSATVMHARGSSLTFMPAGSLARGTAAPSVPGTWRSASFSGPRGASGTDTAYLYTNIQPPGTRAFWKIYGESVAYDVTDTLAKPSELPGAGRSLLDPDGDGTEITNPPAMRSLSGSYAGAGGTFECTGTTCNISRADNGTLSTVGTWTFMPGSLGAGVSRNQDDAYLYFGIWAYEPNTPTAAHEFQWIAGGDSNTGTGAAISATNFGALTGAATFNGGAVGKYVLRNQVGQAARIGTFTAKASFTADFDADTETLQGNITDFQEGSNSLAGWSVYLGSTASAAATLGETGVEAGTGAVTTASIGGVAATGSWAASLHGSDNAYTTLADNDDYTTTKYPAVDLAGVAGWFDAFDGTTAAGSNAAIAGTFGAACTSGPCAK